MKQQQESFWIENMPKFNYHATPISQRKLNAITDQVVENLRFSDCNPDSVERSMIASGDKLEALEQLALGSNGVEWQYIRNAAAVMRARILGQQEYVKQERTKQHA